MTKMGVLCIVMLLTLAFAVGCSVSSKTPAAPTSPTITSPLPNPTATPTESPTATPRPASQGGGRSVIGGGGERAEEKTGVRVGDAAPDFEAVDLEGNKVKLSDFRGKVVFLNFWATWCPYCRAETEALERLSRDLAGENFVLVRVTVGGKGETREKVEQYAKENGITFPMLVDLWGRTAFLYKVTATPTTYIIDEKGVIRSVIIGMRDWDDEKNRRIVTDLVGGAR